MENKEIKSIWNVNIEQKIERYLDAQLEEMVLKNARKAIGKVYGGKWGVIKLVFLMILAIGIVLKYGHAGMGKFWIVTALIAVAVLLLQLYSQRKMEHYDYDKPLNEWIESRIKEFDRSIRLKKNFWFLTTYGVGLLVLLAVFIAMAFMTDITWKELIIAMVIGLAFMIFSAERARRLTLKRMTEARNQLQRLYDQLED